MEHPTTPKHQQTIVVLLRLTGYPAPLVRVSLSLCTSADAWPAKDLHPCCQSSTSVSCTVANRGGGGNSSTGRGISVVSQGMHARWGHSYTRVFLQSGV